MWWSDEMKRCRCVPVEKLLIVVLHGFNRIAEDGETRAHRRGLIAAVFRGLSPDRGVQVISYTVITLLTQDSLWELTA